MPRCLYPIDLAGRRLGDEAGRHVMDSRRLDADLAGDRRLAIEILILGPKRLVLDQARDRIGSERRIGNAETRDAPALRVRIELVVDVAQQEFLTRMDHDVAFAPGQIDLAVYDLPEIARSIETGLVGDALATAIGLHRVGAADEQLAI